MLMMMAFFEAPLMMSMPQIWMMMCVEEEGIDNLLNQTQGMNNPEKLIGSVYMNSSSETTRVGYFGLKFRSLINDKQFKFLAPSGHHA
jgi:hypothetical protein